MSILFFAEVFFFFSFVVVEMRIIRCSWGVAVLGKLRTANLGKKKTGNGMPRKIHFCGTNM